MSEVGETPQKLSRLKTAVIAATAATIGVIGADKMSPIKDAVGIVTPDQDRSREPVFGNKRFPAQLIKPLNSKGQEIDFRFRNEPSAERSLEYDLKTLEAEGFNPNDLAVQIVYGSSYDSPEEELREGSTQQIQEAWGLNKTHLGTYWDVKLPKDHRNYGLWGRIVFNNRSGDKRAIYTSLNFIRPTEPVKITK